MSTVTVEVVRGVTEAGNPRLRAVDMHGHPLAAAICIDGRWNVFAYMAGTPNSQLVARSESDAREWVRWIGEQITRSK